MYLQMNNEKAIALQMMGKRIWGTVDYKHHLFTYIGNFTGSLTQIFYHAQAMKTGKSERSAGPRLPKMPQLQDFQFFDVQRLTELFEQENSHEVWKHQQKQKEEQAKLQVSGLWALLVLAGWISSQHMLEFCTLGYPHDPNLSIQRRQSFFGLIRFAQLILI